MGPRLNHVSNTIVRYAQLVPLGLFDTSLEMTRCPVGAVLCDDASIRIRYWILLYHQHHGILHERLG